MPCAGWIEAISRILIILGALFAGAGASRWAREMFRAIPRHSAQWLARQWAMIVRRWKATIRWVTTRYRRFRLHALNALEGILVKAGLKTSRTIRGGGAAAIGVAAMSGDVVVAPPPIKKRVERLEEWKDATERDSKMATHILIVGFLMIAAGEALDWALC